MMRYILYEMYRVKARGGGEREGFLYEVDSLQKLRVRCLSWPERYDIYHYGD